MSGVAKLYPNAELQPSKQELARQKGNIAELIGSARVVDPAGEVGVEFLFGSDDEGRLTQLPVTYRGEPLEGAELLTEMSHSELGQRYVYAALTDPVAITEIIRTIVQGDDGAEYSASSPAFAIRGSGDEDVTVSDAVIMEATYQKVVGSVKVGDTVRPYLLRMPSLIHELNEHGGFVGTGYSTAKLHLTATRIGQEDAEPQVIAELVFDE